MVLYNISVAGVRVMEFGTKHAQSVCLWPVNPLYVSDVVPLASLVSPAYG